MVHDVRQALNTVPRALSATPSGQLMSDGGLDGTRLSADLRLSGERLWIPYRVYVDSAGAVPTAPLSPIQRAVVGCVYSRHHVGFVRQRSLRSILAVREPWIVPYVVQLAGEYVAEIVTDIVSGLPDLAEPHSEISALYSAVLVENQPFWTLTKQRIASYWDCYHRGRYLKADHYPAHLFIRRIDAAIAASRTSALQRGIPRKN